MKTYHCVCGKTFTDPQRFNGHKQGCPVHIVNKYGSLEAYYLVKNRSKQQGAETLRKKLHERKEQLLQQWIAEKHTCERCGKVMTEKYGSGRFCSKSCANSHKHSEETRESISISINKHNKQLRDKKLSRGQLLQDTYEQNPAYCVVCGAKLEYNKRTNKTCSSECYKALLSKTLSAVIAEKGLHRTVKTNFKYGTYKGIECDSSWELAFVLYQLDHGTAVSRCFEHFTYTFNDVQHNYFPDFIVDGVYYEIKNYYTDVVDAKIKQFPSTHKLVVIDSSCIDKYLEYAVKTYGKDFYCLYDTDKPSWMNNL